MPAIYDSPKDEVVFLHTLFNNICNIILSIYLYLGVPGANTLALIEQLGLVDRYRNKDDLRLK